MKECCQQAARAAWDEGAEYVNGCHDCCPNYRDDNPYAAEVPATPEEPPPATHQFAQDPYHPADVRCGARVFSGGTVGVYRCGHTPDHPIHGGEVTDERG